MDSWSGAQRQNLSAVIYHTLFPHNEEQRVKRSSRFRQVEKGQACQQFPPSGKAQTAQPFPSTGNGQTKLFVAAVRPLFEVIFPDQSGVTVVYFETPLGLLIRK